MTTMCHPWEEVPVWTEPDEDEEDAEMSDVQREVSPSSP